MIDSEWTAKREGFTLVSSGYRAAASHCGASASAGRLSFMVGAELMAVLDDGDLAESWAAAEELSAAEAAELRDSAAAHLLELLEDGLPAADLTDAVTDAAVVFLLAMQRHGISDPKRIPACTVMWTGSEAPERVLFSA